MHIIDLRSDTITIPTKEMLETIINTPLGDDVFEDDPTVNQLEEYAANLFNVEDALLVSSGTQGNLISVLSQTKPGNELLLESQSHIYYYEVGGISAVAGVIPKLIDTEHGLISPEQLEQNIRPANIHFPEPTLLSLENTHNRHGGVAFSPEDISKTAEKAHELGLKVHLDGARIFNAAIYYNADLKDYTKNLDSIQFCLSKGLSAPIGSMVAGSESFVKKARKKRKMLGGGMRQAGVIAAPGLFALKNMRTRLVEDHQNAQKLAIGLKNLGFKITEPQTNILVADVSGKFENSTVAVQKLEELGILIVPFGQTTVRFTTNRMISEDDVNEVIEKLEQI